MKNVTDLITTLLPKKIIRLLKRIGAIANSQGQAAFIVGGVVRDLLLGVKNLDLDIVVEDDAIRLGSALSRELSATLVTHKRFGTCTIVTKDRLRIDIATARKERYEHPGALPTVEFSSLKEDLLRRDFTINAMAVSLNKENFGQLIDFFGGERDLSTGRIRAMHDKSFIDDPTRIFRAVRFEQRFGFAIDAHTGELIRRAIYEEMIDKLEPQRTRDELIAILREDHPARSLKRMADLDELRFLNRRMRLDAGLMKLYASIHKACDWFEASAFKGRRIDRWVIYLMALFDGLSYNETLKTCGRFVFRRGERMRILAYKSCSGKLIKALSARQHLEPSRIYELLEGLPYEVILLVMAKAQSNRAKDRIRDFLGKYDGARMHINGTDLRKMGLRPGPLFKTILTKVLYGKIDGRLVTKKNELEYARRLANRLCA